MTILALLRARFFCGVTMRSPSAFTWSASPGRSPRRRMALGITTCPLVEILLTMVRQSYIFALDMKRCPTSFKIRE